MHANRRRAVGRWAEYVGSTGLAQDVQLQRFRLEASARADYAAINAETRASSAPGHRSRSSCSPSATRARLLRHLGLALTARLCLGAQPNPVLIVTPGVRFEGPATDGPAVLSEAALAHLSEWLHGSNNWALDGQRTAPASPWWPVTLTGRSTCQRVGPGAGRDPEVGRPCSEV